MCCLLIYHHFNIIQISILTLFLFVCLFVFTFLVVRFYRKSNLLLDFIVSAGGLHFAAKCKAIHKTHTVMHTVHITHTIDPVPLKLVQYRYGPEYEVFLPLET